MKIAIDKGHCLYGFDTSADGRSVGGFLESEYDRILGNKVIELLRANGHEVVDVTVDNGNQFSNMYGSLSARTSKANANGVDLYVALHFNAGGGRGVETYLAPRSYYGSDASYNTNLGYASRVQQKMVSLGFVNRGVKTEEFYVLTNTNAHAILIEVCFCDNKSDKELYDSLGVDRIAKAIVEGVLDKTISDTQSSTTSIEKENEKLIGGIYKMTGSINMRAKYKENGVDVWTRWYNMDVESCTPYKNIVGVEIYTELPLKWGVCMNQKYINVEGSGIIEGAEVYGFQAYLTDHSKKTYYWVSSSGDKEGYEWWANNCKTENVPAVCANTGGCSPLNAIQLRLG